MLGVRGKVLVVVPEYNQFQLAPAGPPQGTAELLGQDVGASMKTYLRKGKTLGRERRREGKSEKQEGEYQGQRRREEMLHGAGAGICLQPVESLCWIFPLKEWSLWGEPKLEQRRLREELQRGTVMY